MQVKEDCGLNGWGNRSIQFNTENRCPALAPGGAFVFYIGVLSTGAWPIGRPRSRPQRAQNPRGFLRFVGKPVAGTQTIRYTVS